MSDIGRYQVEQEYIVSDVKNLKALKDKLKEDVVLLNEIEKDFNQNPTQFKNEYINAKINYLKDKYMYYWLFLKRYFDQALFSEQSIFPDFQKEEMKQRGWMFPQAFINAKITTSGDVNVTTEELYMRNFDRIMHGLFSREISQKDCLQLFCVISNMVVIKSIIDANESMNNTIGELNQLQQEIT